MNKRDVRTKEDLELYYNTCRLIKFSDDIKPESISDILVNIKNKDTSKPTYFRNGKEHCSSKRYRSVDDYIKLCKYYFPETKLSDIVNTIIYYISNACKEGKYIYIAYCGNIRKENFRYNHYLCGAYKENFLNKSLHEQSFPNCYLQYKDLI